MSSRTTASLIGLLATTVAGALYLGAGVLDINPTRDTTTITVRMPSSGGLMETSSVDLRGMAIGRVRHITTTKDGVAVAIEFDAKYRIPTTSTVRVANLSAAGEQYLEFRPRSADGPYLADGSVIPAGQVEIPITAGEMMARLDTLLAQLDPAVVDSLLTTLDDATAGRQTDIADLAESATLLANTLRDKQDQVHRLWLNLQTLADNFDGKGSTFTAVAPVVDRADPEVVHLIRAFEDYSHVGEHVWDDTLTPMMHKIDDYVAQLAPELALIAGIVRPATDRLRPLRLDAGSIVDILSAMFPAGGPARVIVTPPK
ncbi:MlaD family protein [Nocardia sp. 2YAB30]|uniref:MlaD family protein n=1 Tax=unclassified Nocardia TaxID=2637762 RepID=UPI003F9D7ECB